MENKNKQYIDIELIKILMKSKNIDEKEMAKLMGVTLPTVKRLLSGADQTHMSGIIFLKVAKALDISANSLLHKEYRINF